MQIGAQRRLRLQWRQIWPSPPQLSTSGLLPPQIRPATAGFCEWERMLGSRTRGNPSQLCRRDGGDARGRRSPPWRRRPGLVLPIPCPLASRVKTTTVLDGGDALGAVIFLKTPFLGTSGAMGFGVVWLVCGGGDNKSPAACPPGAGSCVYGAPRAAGVQAISRQGEDRVPLRRWFSSPARRGSRSF